MGWKEKLSSVFRRGHKDLYDGVKEYAKEHGVAATDVVAASVAAYLASDDEGRETLEKAMEEGRKSGYGGGGGVEAAVAMFTSMADSMSKMFESVNTLRSSVSINSMVSDFETVTGAVERIKGIGAEKGKGSLDDMLADAFIRGIINKLTGGLDIGFKKTKETGKGEIEEHKPE